MGYQETTNQNTESTHEGMNGMSRNPYQGSDVKFEKFLLY